MISKTEHLIKQLEDNLWVITPDKNYPLKLKGSFKFKPENSLVTDIDFTAIVRYNKGLVEIALRKLLERVRKSPYFIFMDFSCGMYKDFIVPWKINSFGCDFDYTVSIEWYNNLKNKNILKESDITKLDSILYSSEINIADLINIERILEPYYDIKWTEQDVYNGYKIDIYDNTTKYDLLDLLKDERFYGVLKLLFVYYDTNKNIDYIPIDLRLIQGFDKTIEMQKLYPYYSNNWYKIMKSYKWKVLDEYKEEYTASLLKIDYQNALLNRLKMYKKIIKNKLLQPMYLSNFEFKLYDEINGLSNIIDNELIKNIPDKPDISYINNIISLLTENINNQLENDVIYYRTKLNKQDVIREDMNFARILYSKKSSSVDELKQKRELGILCPFYLIDGDEYNFLYNIGINFMIEPENLIECFQEFVLKNNILVRNIVNIKSKQNMFLRFSENDENLIEVIEKKYIREEKKVKVIEEKLSDFDKKDIKKIQLFILQKIFITN